MVCVMPLSHMLNTQNTLALKSLLLHLISVDRKHFHIYPKPVKFTKVITVGFVFRLAGGTCTDLSSRGHLGLGSLVALATECHPAPWQSAVGGGPLGHTGHFLFPVLPKDILKTYS